MNNTDQRNLLGRSINPFTLFSRKHAGSLKEHESGFWRMQHEDAHNDQRHAGELPPRTSFLKQEHAERECEDGFEPEDEQVSDSQLRLAHDYALESGAQAEEEEDQQGRRQTLEPFGELHADAADGEGQSGKD